MSILKQSGNHLFTFFKTYKIPLVKYTFHRSCSMPCASLVTSLPFCHSPSAGGSGLAPSQPPSCRQGEGIILTRSSETAALILKVRAQTLEPGVMPGSKRFKCAVRGGVRRPGSRAQDLQPSAPTKPHDAQAQNLRAGKRLSLWVGCAVACPTLGTTPP